MKVKRNILSLFLISSLTLFANTSNSSNQFDSVNCTNCYEPMSDAGSAQTYFKGGVVTLNGMESYDPEGSALSYLWTAPEGIVLDDVSSPTPQFTAPNVNENTDYTFSLIVNDGEFDSDSDSVVISVVVSNTPPEILAIDDITVNKNSLFKIDASASYDNTLTGQLNFLFEASDFQSNQNLTSSIVEFIAPDVVEDTQYIISLTLDDGFENGQSTKDILVTVIANIKPYAIPGDDIEVAAGTEFTLDGSLSYDPDNTGELSYSWSWDNACNFVNVSGSTNQETITLQAPSDQGSCDIFLSVNDSVENSSTQNGDRLFISEYVESGSDGINCTQDKLIEIYNPTSTAIDLSNYEIWYISGSGDWAEKKLLFNKDESSVDHGLSGSSIKNSADQDCSDESGGVCNISSIGPGETLVIVRSDSFFNCDNVSVDNWIEFSLLAHTGDDPIGLFYVGEGVIDAIGQPPVDPGNGWEVAGIADATKDIQLVRSSLVSSGNSSWEASAGTSYEDSEWLVFDADSDITRVGEHYCAICDNYLTVTVTANEAPVANAGLDFTAVVNYEIFVDGTSSTDPDTPFGDLSFNWSSDDVAINNPTSAIASFTPTQVGVISLTLNVSDGANQVSDIVEINIVADNDNPTTILVVNDQYFDSNFDGIQDVDEFIGYNGEAYELHTVYLDASGSFDDTDTGELIYDWVAPQGFSLNDSTIANPSFLVPEYLGSDQTVTFTLNLSDGDKSSSSALNVNLIARMPIIGSLESQYEADENVLIPLDLSSSNDPDGLLDELDFDWNAPSSISLLGVCYDPINSQISTPVTACGSCEPSEICADDTQYNFAQTPIGIGLDSDYIVDIVAEDNDGFESEKLELTISVVAKYPVANAGDNFSVVSGSSANLTGYLSKDPQEQIVSYDYWDDDDFETTEINFISFYSNGGLTPLAGYSFNWQDLDNSGVNLSNPGLVSPEIVVPEYNGIDDTYRFRLTVTDPDGKQSTDDVTLTVIENDSPTAAAGEDSRVLSGSMFVLDGRASNDETETGILTYQWYSVDNEVEINQSSSSIATFIAPVVDFGQEDTLQFELVVGDGEFSDTDEIEIVVANYSRPISPNLFAVPDDKKITLYWDNISEFAIDSLTLYSDFQGYRIYRSQDYGKTWGPLDSLVFNTDGDTLGWRAYQIYDLSEDSDTSLCVYKYDFLDCEKTRGADVQGADPYQSWYSLGSNSGLSQTFIDTNVVNGIDYTYTITAYDRGVKRDTLQFGSYGDGDEDFGEDDETWFPDVPDHIFQSNIEVNTYNLKKLDYLIDSSYVDSLTFKHMYSIVAPDGVNDGDAIWELKRNFPSANPDGFGFYTSLYEEYLGQQSLESQRGESVVDNNYILVTPGKFASDISFPEEDNLDEFVASDCKAVGNGDIFYEIVNVSDLSSGLLKMEIQADMNSSPAFMPFEGNAKENACVYVYPVVKVETENKPVSYMPSSSETSNLILPQDLIYDDLTETWYYQEVGDLETISDLPGVIVNQDSNPATIIMPDYLLECHELGYVDDPNFQNNWSDFFSGVRMRFDNALRLLPDSKAAEISDIYSYPDSSFANVLFLSNFIDGELELQYYGGTEFNKKPNYEYEIEFFKESFPDTATQVAPDNCQSDFKTLLPFRIKNLTTGRYVKVQHSDRGIWGGITSDVPSWFSTPDDIPSHPGFGDCVWQPGELIQFTSDTVIVGDSDLPSAEKTFSLKMYYPPEVINYTIDDFCPNTGGQSSYTDFSTTSDYSGGECVYHEGMIWYATEDIDSQQIGVEEQTFTDEDTGEVTTIEVPLYYEPNLWDDSTGDGVNNNPWIPVYSWIDQTKLVIKPKKWFVDGDYWIADMSLLGRQEEVTEDMLNDIKVVPNPYFVSSNFNEDVNGNRLMFTNLVSNCKITIYTISGEVVDIINHNGGGSAYWDLKNQNGSNVAPGLYIFRAESDSGLDFVSKFAIVR